MFVVIKQSLFDQELSDTECVQVAAWHWCWTGAQTQKLPRLQSPCQVFSPGAGSAPTTVYQEISWHCTIATTERGRPATMQLQLQLQIYFTLPHFSSLYLEPQTSLTLGWSSKHRMGPDFISSSLTVIFPN